MHRERVRLSASKFSLFCAGTTVVRDTKSGGNGCAREFRSFAAVLIFFSGRCSPRKATLACTTLHACTSLFYGYFTAYRNLHLAVYLRAANTRADSLKRKGREKPLVDKNELIASRDTYLSARNSPSPRRFHHHRGSLHLNSGVSLPLRRYKTI